MSESAIYTALTNDATVTGLIGARVYPVIAPQNITKPYAVFRRITGLSVNGLDGELGTTNGRFEINVYAETYAQTKIISEAIKEAMKSSSLRSVLIYDQDLDYEEEVELYRLMLEFRVWFTE